MGIFIIINMCICVTIDMCICVTIDMCICIIIKMCICVTIDMCICVVRQCWDTKGGRSQPQEAFQFQIWQNNVMLSDVRKKPPDDGVKSEDGK